jgi:cytochrome c biogenesis protein CcmG, thiol:disulfide interchange protein DsbE
MLLALLPLAAAITIAACGGDDAGGGDGAQPGAPAVTEVTTKDLPKALAENRKQANQIIEGSTEALDAKLGELRGHPVVVNQWGSWCPPCRAEFPFFAEIAEQHAGDVAFVGVDIQDDRGDAEEFLEEFPVPYPSIYDRDADAVFALNWTGVSPTTWFIDEGGEVVHQRPGQYPDGEALEADIESFLLGG